MSGPELHLKLARAKAGMAPAHTLLDAGGRIVMAQDTELSDTTIEALQHHHRERLARLFRHVGESADGHYLLDAMARHRGVDP